MEYDHGQQPVRRKARRDEWNLDIRAAGTAAGDQGRGRTTRWRRAQAEGHYDPRVQNSKRSPS